MCSGVRLADQRTLSRFFTSIHAQRGIWSPGRRPGDSLQLQNGLSGDMSFRRKHVFSILGRPPLSASTVCPIPMTTKRASSHFQKLPLRVLLLLRIIVLDRLFSSNCIRKSSWAVFPRPAFGGPRPFLCPPSPACWHVLCQLNTWHPLVWEGREGG